MQTVEVVSVYAEASFSFHVWGVHKLFFKKIYLQPYLPFAYFLSFPWLNFT